MPRPWQLATGFTIKVLLFFRLNWAFKSEASEGRIQVFGKNPYSLPYIFYIFNKFFDS